MLHALDASWRLLLVMVLTLSLLGCATVNSSPDEAARQAQEQQDLQAGVNTHVLVPGTHLGTVTP
jgi:hypothetical protein